MDILRLFIPILDKAFGIAKTKVVRKHIDELANLEIKLMQELRKPRQEQIDSKIEDLEQLIFIEKKAIENEIKLLQNSN